MRNHFSFILIGLLLLVVAEPCRAGNHVGCLSKLFGIEVVSRPPVQALNHLESLWRRPMSLKKRRVLEKAWAKIDADLVEIHYPKVLSLPETKSVMTEINNNRKRLSNTIRRSDESKLARRNFVEAEAQVQKWARAKAPVSETRVKKLNEILNRDLKNNYDEPGEYRGLEVETEEASYLPRKMISRGMDHLFQWYGESEGTLHPIELAAQMYQRMVSIHPFPDGNGRTSRFVMDWVLQSHGYPPASFQGEFFVGTFPNIRDRDNPAPGYAEELVTNGVRWSLDRIKSATH